MDDGYESDPTGDYPLNTQDDMIGTESCLGDLGNYLLEGGLHPLLRESVERRIEELEGRLEVLSKKPNDGICDV